MNGGVRWRTQQDRRVGTASLWPAWRFRLHRPRSQGIGRALVLPRWSPARSRRYRSSALDEWLRRISAPRTNLRLRARASRPLGPNGERPAGLHGHRRRAAEAGEKIEHFPAAQRAECDGSVCPRTMHSDAGAWKLCFARSIPMMLAVIRDGCRIPFARWPPDAAPALARFDAVGRGGVQSIGYKLQRRWRRWREPHQLHHDAHVDA